MVYPSIALSRNLLDRVTEEEIYSRQTDRQTGRQAVFITVQYTKGP